MWRAASRRTRTVSAVGVWSARLLVLRPRDRDRGVRFRTRALHVEALVAHRHLVAAQQAHALQAARGPGRAIVLWQRKSNGCGRRDQIKKLWRRLAVTLGIELVGIGLSLGAAAERKLLRRRVGQIDDVGGLEVDLQPVDAAGELLGDVVALVRTRRRGEGDKAGDCGGKQERAADVRG